MGHFDDALSLVNELLCRDPELPDALFLKAKILWEGFGNGGAAKGYLKKIKQIIPEDENIHRWASGYYDEIAKEMNIKKKSLLPDEEI